MSICGYVRLTAECDDGKASKLLVRAVTYHQTKKQLLSLGCETPQIILSTLHWKIVQFYDHSDLDKSESNPAQALRITIIFPLMVSFAYVGYVEASVLNCDPFKTSLMFLVVRLEKPLRLDCCSPLGSEFFAAMVNGLAFI